MAGVFNPETQQIEWKTAWKKGIAGVYNPTTKKVEWKEYRHGGVSGAFNPQTEQVEWNQSHNKGIVAVSTYVSNPTIHSYSYPAGYEDD